MNKRQLKKLEQKRAASKPLWAGRFSLPDEEVYAVYLPSCSSIDDEYRINEDLVVPGVSALEIVIAHCQAIVDHFLSETYQQGMSSNELFDAYRQKGPDPFIRYEERNSKNSLFTTSQPVSFNAWAYAELACRRLCGEEPGEPSRSLALWQGRYRDFDRKRMAGQLLLWRRVCLTRECKGMIGTFPAGTTGHIGMHSSYVGASCFDWLIELPVMFAVDDERCRVTFGVPYDALEFVNSDAEHMALLSEYVVTS